MTEEEKWANYNRSYETTAKSSEGELWPKDYVDIPAKDGQEINEYVSKHYFKAGRF